MRVIVITPPEPVVSWEEAGDHLRLDGDAAQQNEVEAMIAAATAHIDGPDGWLGRAIGRQDFEGRLDGFECGEIALPYPPAIEVTSVDYVDRDGVEQAIPVDRFELLGRLLVPTFGAAWPVARGQREAVRVRWTAGYDVVPAPIRAAILLMVGDLYKFRETAVIGTIAADVPMSTTVKNLLATYRVWD